MGQLLLAAERLEVVLNRRIASRGVSRRVCSVRSRPGQPRNRGADVEERPGTKSLVDPLEFGFVPLKNLGSDRPAFGVHPQGFVVQRAGANVVPADDQVLPIQQVQPGELGQGTDQPGRVDLPLFQGGQPGHRRGRHAPLGANEPESDTGTGHDRGRFASLRTLGRRRAGNYHCRNRTSERQWARCAGGVG